MNEGTAYLLGLLFLVLGAWYIGGDNNFPERLRAYHDECDKAGGLVLRTISRDNVQQMNCYSGVTQLQIKGD